MLPRSCNSGPEGLCGPLKVKQTSAELRLKERKEGNKEGQEREIQKGEGEEKENKTSILAPKGIRLCHPKICHFSIRIILSRRQLRNSRCRKSSLPSPFLSKSRAQLSLCEGIPTPLPYTRKKR